MWPQLLPEVICGSVLNGWWDSWCDVGLKPHNNPPQLLPHTLKVPGEQNQHSNPCDSFFFLKETLTF